MTKKRLLFIDNLRILLTVLIIMHHLAITYGAPGMWYYKEGQPGMVAIIIFAIFTGINQAFIMGFFFMISGYFTPGSYDRKGAWPFLRDRVLRLGVPLLFYIIFIEPLIIYARVVAVQGFTGSFLKFLGSYIESYRGLGTGPLWFIEALLIFNGIYVLWRWLAKGTHREGKMPGNATIAIFAVVLGLATFTVRIWLPMGWNFELLNLQIPFFPQYIGMFIVGTVAYRGNWFLQIPKETGRMWRRITVVIIMLLPVLLVLGAPEGDPSRLRGGLYWQAFAFAFWEQFLCVAIVIALSVLFRERLNHQGKLPKAMSASAYTAYIFHAPVLIFLALSLRGISLHLMLKFLLVAPLAVSLCFLLSNYIRKVPLARRIL